MLSCIIIEDQPLAQKVLKRYIEDMGHLELIGTFADALSALEFLKNHSVELIFLDIHLPKISGIDFLKIVSPRPKIILTTAFSDYAIQSYELDVVDYLLKPFSFERFVQAVSKVIYTADKTPSQQVSAPEEGAEKRENFIFVKTGSEYQKLAISSIQLIKADGDYTRIFTKEKKYLVSHPLRYWLEKLDAKWFSQIHKSYLVNVQHIDKVSGNQVYVGEGILPIGRTFKESFFVKYLEDAS
ncbi:MAG: LytTR family DNA-binding domain-containing protein [Bacteroidia bacterium]|nr:LytTR family DNA-binding domain-containing protein [Bacteroidia bacterium]